MNDWWEELKLVAVPVIAVSVVAGILVVVAHSG